jgi:hypothetical protein
MGGVLSMSIDPLAKRRGDQRYNSTKDDYDFWDGEKWVGWEEWYKTRIEVEIHSVAPPCVHAWVNVGFNSVKMVCKKCNKDQSEEDLINLPDYGIFLDEEEII